LKVVKSLSIFGTFEIHCSVLGWKIILYQCSWLFALVIY